MARLADRARELRNNPTEAEKVLWARLRRGQLGLKFVRQYPLGGYIVDFVNMEMGLIIETDGGEHVESEIDKGRTAFFESQGFTVLSFWSSEILNDIEDVVQVIDSTIKTLTPLSERGVPAGLKRLRSAGALTNPWRKDFPAMAADMNGQPLVYLDSGSSAQKPRQVIKALSNALTEKYANIHRGLYEYSQVKTEQFESVRAKVARFIGAPDVNSIVFTRSSTEAINLVSQSWGRNYLKSGDEIILTEMEHHANIVPWQLLRDQIGIVIKVMPVKDDGSLDLEAFRTLLSERTKLVAVVHVSNAIGTVNPVKKINEIIVSFNPEIIYLVDGSQSVVHGVVNMGDFDPDFFVFTGHKLYGPNGVGVLYGKPEVFASMPPYQGGGDMIDTVTFEKTTYKAAPARFEAGTPAIAEVIAFGAAIDYVSAIGMQAILQREQGLLNYATKKLEEIPGLRIYGTAEHKAGIISFTMDGIHTSDIAMVLDKMGIAVRTGHHCCMPLMKRFGIDGTVRVSLALYSTRGDIDHLCQGLEKVRELMG